MRILVTGSNGMVGKNFSEHSNSRKYNLLTPSSKELDLLDYHAVEKWLNKHQPDMIVHIAGRVGGIQANISRPVQFLLENMDMGRNIVWAAKKQGVKRLINLGSSCMYPRDAENPLKEDMILKGELEPTNEGYALAKIMVSRLCDYINREDSNFLYKTLIPCNIYGRHDKFDPLNSHMIPAIIHKLHQAKISGNNCVEIWGDGKARREFMYAEDLADAMWRSVEHFEELPNLMNIGLGADIEVNNYYRIAADVIGFTGTFEHDLSKPVGMKQKLVCTEKADAWGWKPKYSLQEGLQKTYEFYQDQLIND